MILIECDALKSLHHQLGPKSIDCQEAARGSVGIHKTFFTEVLLRPSRYVRDKE